MREENREKSARLCDLCFDAHFALFSPRFSLFTQYFFSSLIPLCLFTIFSQLLWAERLSAHRAYFSNFTALFMTVPIEKFLAIEMERRGEKMPVQNMEKKNNYWSLIKSGAANNTLGAPYGRYEFLSKRILFIPAFALWIHTGTEWDRVWLAQPARGPTTVAKMLRRKWKREKNQFFHIHNTLAFCSTLHWLADSIWMAGSFVMMMLYVCILVVPLTT